MDLNFGFRSSDFHFPGCAALGGEQLTQSPEVCGVDEVPTRASKIALFEPGLDVQAVDLLARVVEIVSPFLGLIPQKNEAQRPFTRLLFPDAEADFILLEEFVPHRGNIRIVSSTPAGAGQVST